MVSSFFLSLFLPGSSVFYRLGSASSSSDARFIPINELTQRWHPDKGSNGHADPEEAKGRFHQIHEAYQVLSDSERRALYDAGMYDDQEEDVEGFHDFLQEMVSLMATVGIDEPVYSLGELQAMLDAMIHNFASPPPQPIFSTTEQRASSSRVGDAACFSRTAFYR
jgi:DnaJ-class molecular chaperone